MSIKGGANLFSKLFRRSQKKPKGKKPKAKPKVKKTKSMKKRPNPPGCCTECVASKTIGYPKLDICGSARISETRVL